MFKALSMTLVLAFAGAAAPSLRVDAASVGIPELSTESLLTPVASKKKYKTRKCRKGKFYSKRRHKCMWRKKRSRAKMASPVKADATEIFVQRIQPALRSAKNIHMFKFQPACQKCRETGLTVQDFTSLPPTVHLTSEDAGFFRDKLGGKTSYVPGGAQKSMPFFADYGLILEGTTGREILLLSTFSRAVRLITKTREDKVLIGNIDPIFEDLNARVARIFK